MSSVCLYVCISVCQYVCYSRTAKESALVNILLKYTPIFGLEVADDGRYRETRISRVPDSLFNVKHPAWYHIYSVINLCQMTGNRCWGWCAWTFLCPQISNWTLCEEGVREFLKIKGNISHVGIWTARWTIWRRLIWYIRVIWPWLSGSLQIFIRLSAGKCPTFGRPRPDHLPTGPASYRPREEMGDYTHVPP